MRSVTAEADSIDKNVVEQAKALEAGIWECENGHQKGGAFLPESDGVARKCIECKAPTTYMKISEMSGQEKYELEKEKGEAQKIAAEKRTMAKQETENADNAERGCDPNQYLYEAIAKLTPSLESMGCVSASFPLSSKYA